MKLKGAALGAFIGFIIGFIIAALIMFRIGWMSSVLLGLFESQCGLVIECISSPCEKCLPITYLLIFLEPILLGLIFGSIGKFVKKTPGPEPRSPPGILPQNKTMAQPQMPKPIPAQA